MCTVITSVGISPLLQKMFLTFIQPKSFFLAWSCFEVGNEPSNRAKNNVCLIQNVDAFFNRFFAVKCIKHAAFMQTEACFINNSVSSSNQIHQITAGRAQYKVSVKIHDLSLHNQCIVITINHKHPRFP